MGEGDHTGWAGQDVAWSVRPDGEGEGEGGCPWVQRRHDLGWGTARAGVWVGGAAGLSGARGGSPVLLPEAGRAVRSRSKSENSSGSVSNPTAVGAQYVSSAH